MRVYQLASALIPDGFEDAKVLRDEPITREIAGQLYAAVSSIEVSISEGYSRSSGKDRARIFEYALGSVRESMTWYKSAAPILGELIAKDLTSPEFRKALKGNNVIVVTWKDLARTAQQP